MESSVVDIVPRKGGEWRGVEWEWECGWDIVTFYGEIQENNANKDHTTKILVQTFQHPRGSYTKYVDSHAIYQSHQHAHHKRRPSKHGSNKINKQNVRFTQPSSDDVPNQERGGI